MMISRRPTFHEWDLAAASTRLAAIACVLALMSAFAAAQEAGRHKPPADEGLFGGVGRWIDEQFSNIRSSFGNAGKNVENFGKEAGMAAKATADGARDAADALGRLPKTSLERGHEKCATAPNGAPDCLNAATALCKAKGYASGKSMDMTTSEFCPPRAYVAGRKNAAECRDETFVSRALCQ